MIRNLGVTAVVSVIMGVTTLALRSLGPASPPAMASQSALTQSNAIVEQGRGPLSQAGIAQQTAMSQATTIGQAAGQSPASLSAPNPAGGAMNMGGQADGMMMCPCMQMMMAMMQGGTEGGMMGRGMMGGMNQPVAPSQPFSNPRTKDDAKKSAEQYLGGLGNPNLKVGEVEETAASYEINVVTKDDSLVNRLILDKKSGEMKTEY